jgi:hypothetical protein
MKKADLIERIEAIEELNYVLENYCADDNKKPIDYSVEELRELIQTRQAEFHETNHVLNDRLIGDCGPEEKKFAKSQLAKIDRLLAKLHKVNVTE